MDESSSTKTDNNNITNVKRNASSFIDRSRIKSPVSGIESLRVTEVENTLEDDLDETK